jgi:hypothetical protein
MCIRLQDPNHTITLLLPLPGKLQVLAPVYVDGMNWLAVLSAPMVVLGHWPVCAGRWRPHMVLCVMCGLLVYASA